MSVTLNARMYPIRTMDLEVASQAPWHSRVQVGFGTGLPIYPKKLVIGNNRKLFPKQSVQPVILKTDSNQLIKMVAIFWGPFRQYLLSHFCTKRRL